MLDWPFAFFNVSHFFRCHMKPKKFVRLKVLDRIHCGRDRCWTFAPRCTITDVIGRCVANLETRLVSNLCHLRCWRNRAPASCMHRNLCMFVLGTGIVVQSPSRSAAEEKLACHCVEASECHRSETEWLLYRYRQPSLPISKPRLVCVRNLSRSDVEDETTEEVFSLLNCMNRCHDFGCYLRCSS